MVDQAKEKHKMEENGYQTRLKTTEDWFHALSDDEKQETLKTLVDACDQRIVEALFDYWQAGMKYDFLPILPEEVFQKIMNCLSVVDICKCLQVSRAWSLKMKYCAMWKRKCMKAGLPVEASSEDGDDCDTDYMSWFTHHAKIKSLFDQMYIMPLMGHTDQIITMAYYQGKVATGSEDYSVKIWDGATGTCLATIETQKPYNYIKFDRDRLVAAELDYQSLKWLSVKNCGWQMSDFMPRQKVIDYPSHEGEIFCIDYSVDYDLIVAVSDTGATVSQLSTGQEHAVIQVLYDNCVEHLPDQALLCVDPTKKPCDDYYYYVAIRDPCSFLIYKIHCLHGSHDEVAQYYVSDDEGTKNHMECFYSGDQNSFRFHRMSFIDTSGMHLLEDCLWFAGRQKNLLVGGARPLNFSHRCEAQCFKPVARSITFGKLRTPIMRKNWDKYFTMGHKSWPRSHYLAAGKAYHVMLDLGDKESVPWLDVYVVPNDPLEETLLVFSYQWPEFFSRVPKFRFGETRWLDGNTAKVGVCLMSTGEQRNSAGILLQRAPGECMSPRITDYVHVHRPEEDDSSEDYGFGYGFGYGYAYGSDSYEEDENEMDEEEEIVDFNGEEQLLEAKPAGIKKKRENQNGDDEWETEEEEDGEEVI